MNFDYISINDITSQAEYIKWINYIHDALSDNIKFRNFMLKFKYKDVQSGKIENEVLKHPDFCVPYAMYILNTGRWKKCEHVIKHHPFIWDDYKTNVLGIF